MEEHTEHTRKIKRGDQVSHATEIVDKPQMSETADEPRPQTIIAQVVWYIADLLLILLAIRFVLAALGANPSNAFANFIYTTSHPFVAPFFGLFSYNMQYGVSRFESYTVVAMVVYGLLAYAIARLFTINRRHSAHPA